MSRSNPRYTLAFKAKVVQEVQIGKESAFSAGLKYKIGGSMTVYRWVSQLGKGNLVSDMKAKKSIPEHSPQPDMAADTPSESSSELELLRLKVLALETMIDVAEEELGISIRKKSSAKQSKS